MSTDELTLLGPRTYFGAMFEAIDAAREEVLVETYIFHLDRTGTQFFEHAAAAVRRGVRVRMLVDGLGSPEFLGAGEQRIRDAGIQLVIYNRTGRVPIGALHDRMHRKLVVVDRSVAFLGGINIADEYAGLEIEGSFYDLAVRARGPVAADAADLSDELFARATSSTIRRVWRRLRRPRGRGGRDSNARTRIVARDNHLRKNTIEREYVRAIKSARESIVMAHAYFLPSHGLVHALCAAARRGVKVLVVIQGRAEHRVLRAAQWHLYDRLTRAGVTLYGYECCYLHAKVMAVDDRWCTIGSSNLEPWSLMSNLEINLVSEEPAFVAAVKRDVEDRLEDECCHIDMSRQGWWGRVWSALAYELFLWIFVITGGRSDKMWRVAPRVEAAEA
ncbi:MAG TPA: cardiolipin synthase ClsB [Phycisphaerales bacterium]